MADHAARRVVEGDAMRRTIQAVVAAAVSAAALGALGSVAAAGGGGGQPGPTGQRCGALRAAVIDTQGAAGSIYRTISYTNAGHARCSLRGFPSVAFVDAQGRQIGATAASSGVAGAAVVLAPGGKTTFVVREINIGLYPGCTDPSTYRPAAGLRVIPPGGGRAQVVAVRGADACTNAAIQQLYVDAVGTVGI
jgi:hypothetical protein